MAKVSESSSKPSVSSQEKKPDAENVSILYYILFYITFHTSENFTFPDKKFKSMIISVNYYFVTFLSVLICIHIHPGKSSGKSQRVFKQTLGL